MNHREQPRFLLVCLFASLVAIGAAYASAFVAPGGARWSIAVFTLGIGGATASLMLLGASRGGLQPVVTAAVLAATAVVVGGLLVAFSLPDDGPTLWWGLPRRAAIVLYGVGLIPALILPLTYALTFDRLTLSERELDRLRAARDAGDAARLAGE